MPLEGLEGLEGPAIEHAADKRAEQFDEVMNRTDAERETVMLEREKDNLMKPIRKQMVHEIKRIHQHGDKKTYINTKKKFSMSNPEKRHKSWNKDWIGEDQYHDEQPIQQYAENFYEKYKGKSIYDKEKELDKVFNYNKQEFESLKGPDSGGRRRRRRKSRRKRRKSRRKSRRKNKSRKRRRRTRRRRR